MHCYYCGSSLQDVKDICPYCNRNIQGITQGFDRNCFSCSLRIPDDALFCPFCGENNQNKPEEKHVFNMIEENKQTPNKNMKANTKIVEESTCKSCSEKFTIGEEIVKCENCRSYYHQSCWNTFGGCNQTQCKEGTKQCPECKEEIKESALKCWHCGHILDSSIDQTKPVLPGEKDLSTVLKILSFCIPLAGAIMYFNYKGNEPQKAKSACTFAIWGVVIGLLFRIINTMMK